MASDRADQANTKDTTRTLNEVEAETLNLIYEHIKDAPDKQFETVRSLDDKMIKIFTAASVVIGLAGLSSEALGDKPLSDVLLIGALATFVATLPSIVVRDPSAWVNFIAVIIAVIVTLLGSRFISRQRETRSEDMKRLTACAVRKAIGRSVSQVAAAFAFYHLWPVEIRLSRHAGTLWEKSRRLTSDEVRQQLVKSVAAASTYNEGVLKKKSTAETYALVTTSLEVIMVGAAILVSRI
jgi:hypothetical protein